MVDETETPVDPGFGAEASPEPETEVVEAEAETPEVAEQESEAESPPAVEEDDKEKTNPVQDRIDTLTRRWRETERDNDTLRQEIDELRQRPVETPEPAKTLADFNYDDAEYQSHLLERAEKIAESVVERKLSKHDEEKRSDTVLSQHLDREKAFGKDVKDYQDVVYSDDLRITPTMASEIRESEIGPEVAYYLGKHPDEAATISMKAGREQVREIIRLEAKIVSEKAKATSKTVSEAPPPPSRPIGKGNAGVKISTTDPKSDELSDEEWFKREEARTAKLRQG